MCRAKFCSNKITCEFWSYLAIDEFYVVKNINREGILIPEASFSVNSQVRFSHKYHYFAKYAIVFQLRPAIRTGTNIRNLKCTVILGQT
jgi:hypothetical protein